MLQEKRINAFLRMKLEVILTVYEVSNYWNEHNDFKFSFSG